MFARLIAVLAVSIAVLGTVNSTSAQTILKLGTIEREPFAFKQDDVWNGFSIELWQKFAERSGYETEIVEFRTFKDMLRSVSEAGVDAAAANISVTSDREIAMDFSRPIFDSGLLILTEAQGDPSIFAALLNPSLWTWVGTAILLFFIAGAAIAFFERRHIQLKDLDRRTRFGEGFWWSVSVVTNASFTIFTPMTTMGRLLSYALIIVGLFLVSGFVAQITATLTVQELRGQVQDVNDLRGKLVGTTKDSTSSRYLTQNAIGHATYDDIAKMFADLEDGKLQAVVHDAPILSYYAATKGAGKFKTVGRLFNREKYAIALPEGTELLEDLNQEILRLRETGEYADLVQKWFGAGY